jgi:hypothetical protein
MFSSISEPIPIEPEVRVVLLKFILMIAFIPRQAAPIGRETRIHRPGLFQEIIELL